MPVPVWPAGIGTVLADGWRDTLPRMSERSEVDSGPAKQRRITTGAPYRVQVRYLVPNAAALALLEDFYKNDAAAGAVWFNWTHPVKQVVVQARFVAGEEPYTEAYNRAWLATVSLEVRR